MSEKVRKVYVIDSITTALIVSRLDSKEVLDVIFECNVTTMRPGSAEGVYALILKKKNYRLVETLYIERPYHLYSLKNPFKKYWRLRYFRDEYISINLQNYLKNKTLVTSTHSTLLWTCYSKISGFEEVAEGMQEIIFPVKRDFLKNFVRNYLYHWVFPTIPICRYVFSKHYVRSPKDRVVNESIDSYIYPSNDCLVVLNTEGKDDGHFGGRTISSNFIEHNLQIIQSHAEKTNYEYRYILKTHPALGNIKNWLSDLEKVLEYRQIKFCYADELIDCKDPYFAPTEYFIENCGVRRILLCDVTSTVFNYDKIDVEYSCNSKLILALAARNKTQSMLAQRFFKVAKNLVEI